MEKFEDKFAPVAYDAATADSREPTGEKHAASHNKIVLIEIENIAVGHRLRSVTKSKVDELAESIAAVGLLQPIVITEDANLVAGLHRLEACRQLGVTAINAVVIPNLQLQKEIAEIDENLIRNQLTVLEQCDQLKRRKELYEALYPETKRGGYVRAADDEMQPADINDNRVVNDAFSNRAASERKVTPRTIQRAIRIAERLDADTKSRIADSPIAFRFTQLMRLAELEPLMQQEIVAKITDEKLSFPQALKVCQVSEITNNSSREIESSNKTRREVKKWVSSFSFLLRQFEKFTLTELQAVIEQIKRDRLDFSALRRLSAECGENLHASDLKDDENFIQKRAEMPFTRSDAWCKNAPTDDPFPLFYKTESDGGGENEKNEKIDFARSVRAG